MEVRRVLWIMETLLGVRSDRRVEDQLVARASVHIAFVRSHR